MRIKNCRTYNGLALVAVLWIVAALSIMVTGAMHTVRSELRLVSHVRQSVEAAAKGEAAMQLVLQEIVTRNKMPDRLVLADIVFQGQIIPVKVMPLSGLIDINNAPLDLLAHMFTSAGQLDPDSSSALAQAVLDARAEKNEQGRAARFEAVEDLLRVPGLDYTVYARIAKLVTADLQGSGKVNPLAAPADVLTVLANGNEGRIAGLIAARDAGDPGVDTTMLNTAWIDSASPPLMELQAKVLQPDGNAFLVVRRVVVNSGAPDGLPWRVFHAESQYVVARPSGH